MAMSRKRRRLSNDIEPDSASKDEDGPPAPKKHQQQQQNRRSLFVRSLPPNATTETLIAHFSQSFPIKHATAVIDPTTQRCKGIGFITFADPEDAQRALEQFHDTELDGRRIKLEIAEPRHREFDDTLPPEVTGRAKSVNVPTGAAAEARAKREAERKEALAAPPPRLIVRNLPWSIKTADQLGLLFRSYGKVKNVTLPSAKSGRLSGFGFVTIRGRKQAEKALQAVNGKEIDGRTLAVDWAVNKDVWEGLQSGKGETPNSGNEQDITETEDDMTGFGEGVDGLEDEDDESLDDVDTENSEDEEEHSDEQDPEPADTTTRPAQDYSATLFIRNLPFTCSDESLSDHFSQFGKLRYARVVVDRDTERPRGTGFVCFFNVDDARECLRGAPTRQEEAMSKSSKPAAKPSVTQTLLQSELDDPSGKYTIESRVLQISKAVDRSEAARLTEEGVSRRGEANKDKRRLFLLSEGTISTKSPLYQTLSAAEVAMREASAKQRKTLIQSNPSLHLSLTRLSVRNIPRSVTSKDLKALAREAVVGFAKDAKEGKRQRLSREELSRGGEEMERAEKSRKERGVGIVKQAKVVFEGRDGSKIDERSGGGSSRGYGFIEYHSHRLALMGLRWLNGHAIDNGKTSMAGKAKTKEEQMDRKKRLIVEFAIENAQVVKRRTEKENRARTNPTVPNGHRKDDQKDTDKSEKAKDETENKADHKLVKRQRIINRKRAARRAKRKTS